jgi:O-succinylhomoserine sulfhydrylase
MRSAGMTLSPFNAWVVLKGMETLSIRLKAQSERALQMARWLEAQPAVERVYYPGLPSHPQHALAMAQQSGLGGAVVSFVVKGERGRRLGRVRRHAHLLASRPTWATPRPPSPTRPPPRTGG